MVIYKGKFVSAKYAESSGTSKTADKSKFKIYSEEKKVNGGIRGDNAKSKIPTSLNSNNGTIMTSTKPKVHESGVPMTRSSYVTGTLDKSKVGRKALADVSNNIRGLSSKNEKPNGARTSLNSNNGTLMTSIKSKVHQSGAPRSSYVTGTLDKSKVGKKALADVSNVRGLSSKNEKPRGASKTSLNSNNGTLMTSIKSKVHQSGAPRSSYDKSEVGKKALADVSNIRGLSSKNEKPRGARSSMTFGTLTTTALSNDSNRSLAGKVKANLTGGVTASNTSAKATMKVPRTSSNFRSVQVNKTMEHITRKSFPVIKKVSQFGSSDAQQGNIRSLEKSTRKNGFPVKTRAGGKLVPHVCALKGKVSKEKVNDIFTLTALRNQTNKDAVGGVRKAVKPIARTSLQASDDRKNPKSKDSCSLHKSLGTTSARRVKVATYSIAKSFKPTVSCEELAEGSNVQGSDNMKPQSPQSSETKATKKSGRRKSYTSSLISRSKLLELNNEVREQEQLPNIYDEDNPLEVAEYVDDIYEYYWTMEVQGNLLENHMTIQTDATPRMRGILINWLVEVHLKFDLMPETLYLSVALLDRYISLVKIKRNEFQLVGLVCLLLASKYEDFWHPRVEDLISISEDSYTRKQMLDMEKSILKELKFRLNLPTAYVFMLRFLKASQSGKRLEHLAFYLIELCLVDYKAVRFKPSLLCASAVYVARCTLTEVPEWTSLLEKHTRYEELQIRDCAEMILRIHKAASTGLLKVTYDKYLQPEFGGVAAVRPLDGLPSL